MAARPRAPLPPQPTPSHPQNQPLTCIVDQHVDAAAWPALGHDAWQRLHLCLLCEVAHHREEHRGRHSRLHHRLLELLELEEGQGREGGRAGWVAVQRAGIRIATAVAAECVCWLRLLQGGCVRGLPACSASYHPHSSSVQGRQGSAAVQARKQRITRRGTCAFRRLTATTRSPAIASELASSQPTPEPAPVTTATRPRCRSSPYDAATAAAAAGTAAGCRCTCTAEKQPARQLSAEVNGGCPSTSARLCPSSCMNPHPTHTIQQGHTPVAALAAAGLLGRRRRRRLPAGRRAAASS